MNENGRPHKAEITALALEVQRLSDEIADLKTELADQRRGDDELHNEFAKALMQFGVNNGVTEFVLMELIKRTGISLEGILDLIRRSPNRFVDPDTERFVKAKLEALFLVAADGGKSN